MAGVIAILGIFLVATIFRFLWTTERCLRCHGAGLDNVLNGDVCRCERCNGRGWVRKND